MQKDYKSWQDAINGVSQAFCTPLLSCDGQKNRKCNNLYDVIGGVACQTATLHNLASRFPLQK